MPRSRALTDRFVSCAHALRERDLPRLRDCLGLSPEMPFALLEQLLKELDALPARRAPHIDATLSQSGIRAWIAAGDVSGIQRLLAAVYEYLDATESDGL